MNDLSREQVRRAVAAARTMRQPASGSQWIELDGRMNRVVQIVRGSTKTLDVVAIAIDGRAPMRTHVTRCATKKFLRRFRPYLGHGIDPGVRTESGTRVGR